MSEQYFNVIDNYSVTNEKKVSSTGSIPYVYSCLKDHSYEPQIPENVCEKLKRYTDYKVLGMKPKHFMQTVFTTYIDTEVTGYMISNPIPFSSIDLNQWKKMCDAFGTPEFYDFYYEMAKIVKSPDGFYTPAAGLQAIRFDKNGNPVEFFIRNARFDLDVIKNSAVYAKIKEQWSRIQHVEQLIGMSPYKDDITLETIVNYYSNNIGFDTEGEKNYKLKFIETSLKDQTDLFLGNLKEIGILSEDNQNYIETIRNPNSRLQVSTKFDKDDNITEVILKQQVVENFKRI